MQEHNPINYCGKGGSEERLRRSDKLGIENVAEEKSCTGVTPPTQTNSSDPHSRVRLMVQKQFLQPLRLQLERGDGGAYDLLVEWSLTIEPTSVRPDGRPIRLPIDFNVQ